MWYKKFGQQQPRAIADKRLYDMVQSRQIHWNDFESHDIASDNQRETLTKHVKQAGAKDSGNQMRIEKLTKEAKVDGAVALSMANQMCMQLNISAKKEDVEDLYKQVADGGLTYQELLDILAARRVKVND